MLDLLKDAGRDVIAVGKIFDIFDGEGVTEKIKTTGNTNGIAFTKALQTRDFEGLAFVNLVDFDMLYGHRRDVAGCRGRMVCPCPPGRATPPPPPSSTSSLPTSSPGCGRATS